MDTPARARARTITKLNKLEWETEKSEIGNGEIWKQIGSTSVAGIILIIIDLTADSVGQWRSHTGARAPVDLEDKQLIVY